MIACLDVGYSGLVATAACVAIENWNDESPTSEHVTTVPVNQAYQPGEFFRRELPCLKAVLSQLAHPPSHILVDGYVWLDQHQHRGLGAYLYESLGQQIAIVGVAKNQFRNTSHAIELLRGDSRKPLFITAAGISADQAAARVASMAGPFRLPSMLKRVDQLSRGKL